GLVIFPWRLYSDLGAYIFTWLIGYSALLGSIAGVMLADYYIIRRCQLNLEQLYLEDGEYTYGGSGFNLRAIAPMFVGIASTLPWFFEPALGKNALGQFRFDAPPFFETLYTYAWFVSLLIAGVCHILFTVISPPPKPDPLESSRALHREPGRQIA